MAKLTKWLMMTAIPLFSLVFISCGDDDEPSLPSTVTTEKQEKSIVCLTSNYTDLPSYLTTLYEDSEFKYEVAVRNPKFEMILLPYHKENDQWVALFDYDKKANVGSQLTPLKLNDEWVCSVQKYGWSVTSLEDMTNKLGFNNSTLSVAPFEYYGKYYGFLTVEGNKKVNFRIFCSLLKYNRTQGSSTFGYIQSVKIEYQFY